MIGFSHQVEIRQPPFHVFEMLADMDDLDKWNPSVASSKRTHGNYLELNSKYESTLTRGPVKMTASSTLVAVEAGRTVRYEGPIGPFWSVDTLVFRPARHGTQLTFHNQTGSPTWMIPLHPLLNALFQRQARRAVNGALEYLAANPPEPDLA